MLKNYTYKIAAVALSTTLFFSSCEEELLEYEPENVLLEEEAIQTKEDLELLLNAAYEVTANGFNGQSQNLHELLSDNLEAPDNQDDYIQVYNRRADIFNGSVEAYYKEPHFAINRANVIRESVDLVSGVSEADRKRLIAEADFLRAINLFDVVLLWAQPYGYTPNNTHPGLAIPYEDSRQPLPRSSVQAVYDYVITNLETAIPNLPDVNPGYATSWAAKALLAKVYFQMGEYQLAVQNADDVLNNGPFQFETSDSLGFDRFLTGQIHPEAIYTTVSSNTGNDNRSGGYTGNWRKGNQPTLTVAQDFINFYFPSGLDTANNSDKRVRWFTVLNEGQPNQRYSCDKFDKDYFNIPLLHVTDLKLLRAEAIALSGGNIATAVQDLRDIQTRANSFEQIADSPSTEELLRQIRYERRLEMIGEGDRLRQLKRRGAVEGEDIVIRGADWDCNGMVLQFPNEELSEIFELNPQGGC